MASVYEIDIAVENNTLVVGVNGGNVTGAPGDTITWSAADDSKPFTLEFFQTASEPAAKLGPGASEHARACAAKGRIDVSALPRWPFVEPQPKGGIVGPTTGFTGTLAGHAPPPTSFKYYVSVGNLSLDPIVIVDR
jgi:hypothetical protein